MPQGIIVIKHIWAITRDRKYWNEPDKFLKERFEDEDGVHFEFTPFGVGQRICPAIVFVYAIMKIALASLIYHFDWDLHRVLILRK